VVNFLHQISTYSIRLLAIKVTILLVVKEVSLRLYTPGSESVCTLFLAGTIFVHVFLLDDVIRCAALNLVIRRGSFQLVLR
jgi:hypothetical protein